MFNQKVLTIGLAVVLVISLVALFLVLTTPRKISQELGAAITPLKGDLEKLARYVPPYVYTGEAVGFVIEFENGAKFYFGADTGLTAEMEVIGDFYKPDVAFIPIGNFYTMDHKAGAYAAKLLNPARYIVPNHYASFPMLEQDPEAFFIEVAKYNLRAKPIKFIEGEEQELMEVKTVWLGHGTWRFVSPKGVEIFIDSQFVYNPKYPEGWKDMTRFAGTDLILISHGHFDHTTIADLQLLLEYADPIIIAPFELGVWLKGYLDAPIMPISKGANITKKEIIAMGVPPELAERVGNVRVHLVPATHSSSGTPLGEPVRY